MNGLLLDFSDYELIPDVQKDTNGRVLCGLAIGDILRQNQALLLELRKGELKEWPVLGVGIGDMLLDDDPAYWRAEIREQMTLDGQNVEHVSISTTGVTLRATYN